MKTVYHANQCSELRKSRTNIWGSWWRRVMEQLSDHVANCPRCQRRLAMKNRVELALMLIKSQPLNMGLLARANNKALNILKHSLRNAPKSVALRAARTDLTRLKKIHISMERVLNVAACVFVVIMIKAGQSNSLLNYQKQGKTAIKNYYARNLDSQMVNEIFPEDSSSLG